MRLNKTEMCIKLAYGFWFLENFKYAISILLFSYIHSINYYLTAGISLGLFAILGTLGFHQFIVLKRPLCMPKEAKLLLAFLLLSGVSLLWTNRPLFSFSLWGNIVIDTVNFFLICQMAPIRSVVEKSLQGYVMGTFLTTLLALIMNPLESEVLNRLGMFGILDAVRLGNMTAISILFTLYFIVNRKERTVPWWHLCQLGIFTFAFVYTLYKAGAVALVIAALMILLLSARHIGSKLKYLAVLGIATTLIVAGNYHRLVNYTQLFNGQMLQTASGRTILWQSAWEMVLQKPVTGYGAGATLDQDIVERVDPEFGKLGKETGALNEWLGMWMQYGLIGLSLAIGLYWSLIQRSMLLFGRAERQVSSFCLAILVYYLIRSPMESILVGFLMPEPLILLLAFWLRQTILDYQVNQFRAAPVFSASPTSAASALGAASS